MTVVRETGGVSGPETDRPATVKHPDGQEAEKQGSKHSKNVCLERIFTMR